MKKKIPSLAIILALATVLAACNLPGNGTPSPISGEVATTVAKTLEALTLSAPNTSPGSPSQDTLQQPSLTTSPYPSQTPEGTKTTEPGYGSITGSISGYPYGGIPALAIVAIEQEGPYYYWYELLPAGSSYFSMDGYVTTGNYQVIAYDSAGHKGGCTALVLVKNNETTSCDIINWGGSYPNKPSDVPSP